MKKKHLYLSCIMKKNYAKIDTANQNIDGQF